MHEPSQSGGCLAVSSLSNVRNITTCLKIHNIVGYIFPRAPCSSSVRSVPPARSGSAPKSALINLIAEENEIPRKTAAGVYATLENCSSAPSIRVAVDLHSLLGLVE
jgi:hypothetical protein